MRYKLCGWEENGYHDSDWVVAYYDDETDTLGAETVGSTAFYGVNGYGQLTMPLPTPEVVERARKCLARHIFAGIRQAEDHDVFEPQVVQKGTRVVLLEDHRNQVKEADEVPCGQCGGTGAWVNPRNKDDRRDCFGCKGRGTAKANWRAKKGEDGKVEWVTFPAGTTGVVAHTVAYGHFYRNGYNQPGRSNTTVRFVTDDGRSVKAPLEKLRLARDPATDEELRQRAEELSHGHQYKAAVSAHGGWLDYNWARDVALGAQGKPVGELAACPAELAAV